MANLAAMLGISTEALAAAMAAQNVSEIDDPNFDIAAVTNESTNLTIGGKSGEEEGGRNTSVSGPDGNGLGLGSTVGAASSGEGFGAGQGGTSGTGTGAGVGADGQSGSGFAGAGSQGSQGSEGTGTASSGTSGTDTGGGSSSDSSSVSQVLSDLANTNTNAGSGSSSNSSSISQVLSDLANTLNPIGSAQAAPAAPANSGIAAIQDAAQAAAKTGTLSEFLEQNYTAAAVLSTMPSYLAGLQAVNSASVSAAAAANPYGALQGPSSQQAQTSTYGQTTGDRTNTAQSLYGTLGDLAALEAAGQIGPIGSTIAGLTAGQQAAVTPVVTTATTPDSWTAGTPGAGVGNVTGQFTTAGPIGSSTTTDPYAGMTAVGPDSNAGQNTSSVTVTGTGAGTSTGTEAVTGTGVPGTSYDFVGLPVGDPGVNSTPSTVTVTGTNTGTTTGTTTGTGSPSQAVDLGPVIDVPTLTTIDVPLATTTTPTTTTPTTTTPTTTVPVVTDTSGTDGSGTGTDTGGTVTDTLPGGGTVITPKTRIIGGREYVGLGNANKYGSGAESVFFRPWQKEVAAADGGYFDADSYFSDGGLTTPSNPPSMPTTSSFPTMAFTDGQGPVGNIAQPPGLLPSDAVGSDAPHASPMAPSPAAAAPSMSTLQQTLGARNTNASPAMAPVPQNPNVGYALGQSPLSNLRNS
jgi:hypothetical protein